MSFTKQILGNWKKYQIHIILLILFLIFLVFFQKVTHTEGFEPSPSPSSPSTTPSTTPSSPSTTPSTLYMINNFPKQEFVKVWEGLTEDLNYISFWQRKPLDGYFPIGQISLVTEGSAGIDDLESTTQGGLKYLVKGGIRPIDFEKIWDNRHLTDQTPVSIWKVIPPTDYCFMSDVAITGLDKPDINNFMCLPKSAVNMSGVINNVLWQNPKPTDADANASPPNSVSVWNIGSDGFYLARDSLQKPDNRSDKVFSLKEETINNQENDPSDNGKPLRITLMI
jgi:hypothetical protein